MCDLDVIESQSVPRMFLDMSGDAVQMLGSLKPAEIPPGWQGLASGLHSHVDILRCPLGGRGQDLAR